MKDTTTIMAAPTTAPTGTLHIKKKKHRQNGFAITSEELLYEISNAGMLFALRGVMGAAGSRKYFFDRNPDVKSIIDKFNDHNEVGA